MITKEITFAELRTHCEKVKAFLADHTGIESHEIGIYAGLEDDLMIYDEDIFYMGDDFAKAFDITVEDDLEENTSSPTWFSFITLMGVLLFLLSILFYYPLSFLMFLVGIIAFLLIANLISNLFNNEPNYRKPNKKQWNPDALTVADMVCMAVEKKEVKKKDIFFVIKRS